MGFVMIIIGIVLLSSVATQVIGVTQKTTESETIDITAARLAGGDINETYEFVPTRVTEALGGWRSTTSGCQESDLLGSAVLTNTTDALTETTDYVIGTGYFTLVNSTTVWSSGNDTAITLEYCQDDYVSGWANNITNLIIGFFALAILGVGIAITVTIFRKSGVM